MNILDKEIRLDLKDFFAIIRKRLVLIISITLLCTMASAILSFFVIKPTYRTDISIVLGKVGASGTSNLNEITMYQQLLKTYAAIASSNTVAEGASRKLGNVDAKTLSESITITPQTDTQIIGITALADSSKQAYDNINALTNSFISEANKIYPKGNLSVLDKAVLPLNPIKPNKQINIAIAFFVGLMVSIGLGFILEFLDRTIKTEAEVQLYLELPVIGAIANAKDLITIKNPKSLVSESYRMLRTNIMFSSLDKKIQTIMVTSSVPGEGKTTVASNLAVIMAQSGKRTILIDCDLRKPSLHKIFEVSNLKGLSNYLIGEIVIADVVNQTQVENLEILSSGVKPANQAELLGSEKMGNFIKSLKEHYDYIILDTPPVVIVTDAQLVSQYADGCLLVIAAGEVDRSSAMKGKDLLTKVNAKILGVVLNKVEVSGKKLY